MSVVFRDKLISEEICELIMGMSEGWAWPVVGLGVGLGLEGMWMCDV